MSEKIFGKIYDVLAVLSIFKLRAEKFREELNFFEQHWQDASQDNRRLNFLGAYKRLEHEVMFLSVEAFSLYEGISKRQSLYSKVIKLNETQLSKVDKAATWDQKSFICAGIFEFDGEIKRRDSISEENDAVISGINQDAYESRKELRDKVGITTPNHDQLDKWFKQILDDHTILKLSEYRKLFAHRLNSLEKLKKELNFSKNIEVTEILDVIEKFVDAYSQRFQEIIAYSTSKQINGVTNFEYDSLARLELADTYPKVLNSSYRNCDSNAPTS